jgi:2-polyprenyl-6-hydroxyphenyl methylase/3-demethylubiquinone-9 3-methyltransferase
MPFSAHTLSFTSALTVPTSAAGAQFDVTRAFEEAAVVPARIAWYRARLPRSLTQKRALVIGCGRGRLAENFARAGADVVALDTEPAALALARAAAAREALPVEYLRASGEELPVDDASVDVVTAGGVFEHSADLEMTLAEIRRVLRPGGILLFDTLNRTLRSRLVAVRLWREWPATRFLPRGSLDADFLLRPSEMNGYLAAHGIALERVEGFSPRLGLAATVALLRRARQGRESVASLGERLRFHAGRDVSLGYLGAARRLR